MKKYSYLFVNLELSEPQRVVQSSHAAIEAGRNLIKKGDVHPNLVVIGIKNETKLIKILKEISEHVKCCSFFDFGMVTSFITEPVVDRNRFERFSILK